ncbi:hypothetical protein [Salibacterium aidingense]|uniref:hypothetical protein n=1 Tax=Salibacterium aidingense TaxID=384933 RepID=UPI000404EF0C|nr:hypothetical protein [Salibacterium aidingense]
MQSIISYPSRGPWGSHRYRGNCTGHLIKDLLNYFQPKKFVELFAGSGTGRDVARHLDVQNSVHLDLNPTFGGWNALKDEMPTGSDFVFSHPPYHNIIPYSGEEWGRTPHMDDLSRCSSYKEFIQKLNVVNAKVYASLTNGGRHAVLVGDVKQEGTYYSIIKDMAYYGELEQHLIKVQHNCLSDLKTYQGAFIPIVHEHVLIFRKTEVWMIPIVHARRTEQDIRQTENVVTWRDLVQAAVQALGGRGTLSQIYHELASTKKASNNKHWREKVRQTLQLHEEFIAVRRGLWSCDLAGFSAAS